jgi:hypothetical protein
MQFCILLINSRRKEGEVGGRGRWGAKQKEYLGVCKNKGGLCGKKESKAYRKSWRDV